MKAIIIGASGQIGYAFYQLLNKAGWEVVLLSRSPLPYMVDVQTTEVLRFDRYERASFDKMMSAGADLVIDLVAFGEEEGLQLLEMQSDYSSLIVLSSSSVYRDAHGRTLDEAGSCGFPLFDKPILETNATVEAGPATYSTRKVALEEVLLSGSQNHLTILRPCAIYGAYSQHPREWWFVKRMLDQRRQIPVAYRGESLFHTTSGRLIAEVGLAAVDLQQTQVVNVGDASPLSVLEIGETIADYLDYNGKLIPIDKGEGNFKDIGITPWSVPRPFVLDTTRSEGILAGAGLKNRDYVSSIHRYLFNLVGQYGVKNWESAFPQLAAYPFEQFDYAAEDRYLAHLAGKNLK